MNSTIPIYAAGHAAGGRYLNPYQARQRPPTAYENQLGDAMERAFAAGHWELDALVAQLNQSGCAAPDGKAWTNESFQAEMAVLGQ
jgi:hypothetical protein